MLKAGDTFVFDFPNDRETSGRLGTNASKTHEAIRFYVIMRHSAYERNASWTLGSTTLTFMRRCGCHNCGNGVKRWENVFLLSTKDTQQLVLVNSGMSPLLRSYEVNNESL
jgi:hypothetical protein